MNKVAVISLDKKFDIYQKEIQNSILKMLEILNKNNVLVEIYLINSQKMRFLNKKFRGKDKTTTVLSFEEPKNFISFPSKHKKIGEIYLNLTNNQRQTTNDYCRLSVVGRRSLVHGLLHLLGYNHYKKNDRIKMERREQFLLSQILNPKS